MRCFKVTLEYDGTDFAGYQYQVGLRTVQGELEKALKKLLGTDVRPSVAGRTDAGVHALGQVVGFRAQTSIPLDRMCAALNSVLPRDVAAVRAEQVDAAFHARFSARWRTYVYAILNRREPSALWGRYSYHVPQALDVEAMGRAASYLEGEHDFTSWANDLREAASPVRHMRRCRVRRHGAFILVTVQANALLKGMVRNVVGTLVEVGMGKRSPEEIPAITAARSRAAAGPCAPARGLCLLRVEYEG
ncbi:MAG: tRNA pseudouridine(38-40) synthase TruA [Chthonomonadales bacterium]